MPGNVALGIEHRPELHNEGGAWQVSPGLHVNGACLYGLGSIGGEQVAEPLLVGLGDIIVAEVVKLEHVYGLF